MICPSGCGSSLFEPVPSIIMLLLVLSEGLHPSGTPRSVNSTLAQLHQSNGGALLVLGLAWFMNGQH
jgi:hypothetical protein